MRKTRPDQVTLTTVADACGVSRMTASYALRGDRKFVSQATIERVQAAARKLEYDPGSAHAARRLRYQRSDVRVVNHVVALFFPLSWVEERYWALILRGLHAGFAADGFGMLMCDSLRGPGPLDDQLPVLFRRGDVDGAVVFATEQYRAELIGWLRCQPGFARRPIVTLTEAFRDCASVVVDDVGVGRLAASHLLNLGHRHLATFKAVRYNSPITLARIDGQRQAFTERGLDPEQGLHVLPWLWDDGVDLQAGIAEALRRQPEISGILAPNDGMGVRLAQALLRQGYRIPDDVSIIGTDDCTAWPSPTDNRWSTVRIPLLDLGRTAARSLVDAIQGATAPRDVVIPVDLVLRGSTAAH